MYSHMEPDRVLRFHILISICILYASPYLHPPEVGGPEDQPVYGAVGGKGVQQEALHLGGVDALTHDAQACNRRKVFRRLIRS